jgi:hypothetical protein
MEKGTEKYNEVINLLRKAEPVLYSGVEIEKEVIRSISGNKKSKINISDAVDFLFGWIYIGWVRRSLIATTVILIAMFVWQQSIMLKQINFLSKQIIVSDETFVNKPSQQLEKLLIKYKGSSGEGFSRDITISEKQMNQLLESVNELKVKYKDLIDLIEENPELKKYIEEKLVEKNQTKTKL